MIVYGDFNCPYSRLASVRVDALRDRGVEIQWRAVQHDPGLPANGVVVDGELAHELRREITEIRGLTAADEQIAYDLPDVRPNTARDCSAHAALDGEAADRFRRLRFEEIWARGPAPSHDGVAPETAATWQSEWEATPGRMVPLLVSVDRRDVIRGIEALQRLRALLDR